MLYQGQFRTVHDNDLITVQLVSNNLTTTTVPIKLAKNSPVKIEQSSDDGIFSAVKSRSCTITIITDRIYEELYTGSAQGVAVTITNTTKKTILFEGYLTPCAYSQDFVTVGDSLELEAVDKLSTLENVNYYCIGGDNSHPEIKTVQSILYHAFAQCGYSGDLYYQYGSIGNMMNAFYLSESNFFDDDDEKTPWTMYEIIENICLFFGWSAVPYGNNVYLIDYQTLNRYKNAANSSAVKWYKIPSRTGSITTVAGDNKLVTISKDSYAGKGHSLSYDEVYNKISISDSIYEVEELTNDIFDSDAGNLINTSYYFTGASRFYHTHNKSVDKAWSVYFTKFLFNSDSCWSQKFFMPNTYTLASHYSTREHTNWYSSMYSWGDTIFAMPEKYWVFDEFSGGSSSNSSKDVIAFNVLTCDDYDEISGYSSAHDVSKRLEGYRKLYDKFEAISNCPVMTFTYPEEIQYQPGNGNSFICFKGDLWWQCNEGKTEVWDSTDGKRWYTRYPYDGIETMAGEYTKLSRGHGSDTYNQGWPMLKCKLQIGDKYWNGSNWTSTESTFWINYHKEEMGVSDTDDERLTYGAWNHPVYNTLIDASEVYTTDARKLIGEDYYAIPLKESLAGQLKFTLYPPRQQSNIYIYTADGVQFNSGCGWADVSAYRHCPVIYMKDFELVYKYVPNGYNWMNIDEFDDGDDIIYTNLISDKYCTEFDDLELKINTYADKKPVSRSYIMNSTKKYVCDITKNGVSRRQEHNLVQMYYDHFSTPKKIYECLIHGYLHPADFVQTTATSGNFIIDEQSYDVKLNHNDIKLIEY